MSGPRIHLIAPAGPCDSFFLELGVRDAREFCERVQSIVGETYRVTAAIELMTAIEDETRGGRTDDAERAADIGQALANDDVVALIAVRGGAWFARVLSRIDFSVLGRRSRPVAVFGFSELTTLINIVGAHAKGRGIHDMGPAFLVYGLRHFAATRPNEAAVQGQSPKEYTASRLQLEFDAYFQRVIAMIAGRAATTIHIRHVRGAAPSPGKIRVVGGNLTVLSTLVGSRYADCIKPRGRWLLLEDFNDKPERFDRFLAHLTLAGFWDQCDGVLLGDFHHDVRDLRQSILAMLEYHIPASSELSILTTDTVGHIWPMTPLPLHLPLTLTRTDKSTYTLVGAEDVVRIL